MAGFRARLQARPEPTPLDMPDDPRPDPDDDADFELPDQQLLIDAFMTRMCKESQHDFRGLSTLLANLPDPSPTGSHEQVEAMPVAEARARGLIPEASEETLNAFSFSEMKLYKHATAYKWTVDELIAAINLIKSTDFKVEDINVDLHKRVVAKKRYVDTGILMSYVRYMIYI